MLSVVYLKVFQRRVDNSVDFYRDHQSYEEGFGDVTGNFWLGNGLVHRLTSTGQWALKVDLMDWNDTTAYAHYDHFALGPAPAFGLDVGGYHGTAGESKSEQASKQASKQASERTN